MSTPDESDWYEMLERLRRVEDFAIVMEPILNDELSRDAQLSPEDLRAAVEKARDAAHSVNMGRW